MQNLVDRSLEAPVGNEKHSIIIVGRRVAGHDVQSALKFSFGIRSIVVIEHERATERYMRLGQGFVQLPS